MSAACCTTTAARFTSVGSWQAVGNPKELQHTRSCSTQGGGRRHLHGLGVAAASQVGFDPRRKDLLHAAGRA